MKIKTITLVAASAAGLIASAINPFLPLWEYIPDGEPYVFDDPDNPGKKRVYVYGSHDIRRTEFCGRDQVVWSAPVDSLDSWRYDGVIFKLTTDRDGNTLGDGQGDVLYAPDVCEITEPDGSKTYYLYPNAQAAGREGTVARSKRPDGPFEVCNWSADDPLLTDGVLRFDPAVFVDDDGRVYGYWGYEDSWAAELDPATMATVKPGTEPVKDPIGGRHDRSKIDRFYEASSMRKIADKYVYVYSRYTIPGELDMPEESNYTLAYSYGDSPLGPFTFGGTIIDGRGLMTDADGKHIVTAHPNGNTHGGLCEINGQWYVFYHRQCGADEYSRQAMVAPVTIELEPGPGGKVTISQAEYTSEGFELEGLDPFRAYPAGIACFYTAKEPARAEFPRKIFHGSYPHTGRYDGDPASASPLIDLTVNPMVNNTDGSTIGYKYYNFNKIDSSKPLSLDLNMLPTGIEGTIEIFAGENLNGMDTQRKIGELRLPATERPMTTTLNAPLTNIEGLTGRQPLYLRFSSPVDNQSLCTLYYLQFRQAK